MSAAGNHAQEEALQTLNDMYGAARWKLLPTGTLRVWLVADVDRQGRIALRSESKS